MKAILTEEKESQAQYTRKLYLKKAAIVSLWRNSDVALQKLYEMYILVWYSQMLTERKLAGLSMQCLEREIIIIQKRRENSREAIWLNQYVLLSKESVNDI